MIRSVAASWIPLSLLLGYGVVFAATALGCSLPAFDDHPGQFFRLWHALTRGLAPWTWNADWWMGFPELQFYPPGYVYLGAVLHYLSLTALSPAGTYQVLVWTVYLTPGITAFALLARLLRAPWLALPGAFVALTLSAETLSGVDGGVRTGMIAARLGWGLLPLLMLGLIRWIEHGGRSPWIAAPLVAAIVLSHPGHAPAAVVLVALAAFFGAGPRARRLAQALALLVLAGALTTFWTIPLLAHLEEARALAWGDFSAAGFGRQLARPLILLLVGLGLAAPLLARGRRDASSRPLTVLAAFLPAMLVVLAADRSSWLPPHRLVDSVVLGIVLVGGAGLGLALGAATTRWGVPGGLAALAATAVIATSALDDRTLTVWPQAARWPTLTQIERGLRLPALWAALQAAPPGRILFVRSGVPLVYGTEWYRAHTHVTALAPLYTGRQIVNGTFTHPSAIAALVYTGSPASRPIQVLVERLDGHTLFGEPLGDIADSTLERFMGFLGVSAVVMLEEDAGRFPALESSGQFVRAESAPFILYTRRTPVALPAPVAADRWQLPPLGPGWTSARVAFSRLWRAESSGARLATRRGPLGDLELELSDDGTPVTLAYGPARWEWIGVGISALGALWFIASYVISRRASF
jgi:hypothetical protein